MAVAQRTNSGWDVRKDVAMAQHMLKYTHNRTQTCSHSFSPFDLQQAVRPSGRVFPIMPVSLWTRLMKRWHLVKLRVTRTEENTSTVSMVQLWTRGILLNHWPLESVKVGISACRAFTSQTKQYDHQLFIGSKILFVNVINCRIGWVWNEPFYLSFYFFLLRTPFWGPFPNTCFNIEFTIAIESSWLWNAITLSA